MVNFSIDLEELDTFKNPASVYAFLSEDEIKDKNLISLIGKITAKKAFLKCIGENIEERSNYKKIEIKNFPSGRPYIILRDKGLRKNLKNKKISISISHTNDLAVAVCIIYDNNNKKHLNGRKNKVS